MPDLPVITDKVPLPVRCTVKSYGKRIDLQPALRALKEGQSFVVDGESARGQALNIAARLEIPVTTEKIDDEGHFRVWRKPKEAPVQKPEDKLPAHALPGLAPVDFYPTPEQIAKLREQGK